MDEFDSCQIYIYICMFDMHMSCVNRSVVNENPQLLPISSIEVLDRFLFFFSVFLCVIICEKGVVCQRALK